MNPSGNRFSILVFNFGFSISKKAGDFRISIFNFKNGFGFRFSILKKVKENYDAKNIYIGGYGNTDIEINSVEYEDDFSNELNLGCVPSYEKGPDNSPDDYGCKEDWWNSDEYVQWLGTWHDELFDAEDLKNVYFKDMCRWFASDINKAIKNYFKEAE